MKLNLFDISMLLGKNETLYELVNKNPYGAEAFIQFAKDVVALVEDEKSEAKPDHPEPCKIYRLLNPLTNETIFEYRASSIIDALDTLKAECKKRSIEIPDCGTLEEVKRKPAAWLTTFFNGEKVVSTSCPSEDERKIYNIKEVKPLFE